LQFPLLILPTILPQIGPGIKPQSGITQHPNGKSGLRGFRNTKAAGLLVQTGRLASFK
jgi:hypothetical protein